MNWCDFKVLNFLKPLLVLSFTFCAAGSLHPEIDVDKGLSHYIREKYDPYCSNKQEPEYVNFETNKQNHIFVSYLIYFKLFSKDNPVVPEIKVFKDNPIEFKNYKPHKKTVFVIPGYYNDSRYQVEYYFQKIREGLLKDPEHYNIIEVDWLDTVYWKKQKMYHALSMADFVGKHTAKAITNLRKVKKICSDEKNDMCKGKPYFMLIAHEMGTVVAASAGLEMKHHKIDRIMGLSPFKGFKNDNTKSLSKKSANLVEVIYTSLCSLPEQKMHRNFYINKGMHPQPHCGKDPLGHCSIKEAYLLYANSMVEDNNQVKAILCTNYKEYVHGGCQGFPALKLFNNKTEEEAVEGNYYLNTVPPKPKLIFSIEEQYY